MKLLNAITPLLLLIVLISGCVSEPENQQQNYSINELQVTAYKLATVEITTAEGIVHVNAEIADTPEKQQKGLMFRTALDENEGMLFVFGSEQTRTFWMKNVQIPLDIIFISADKSIVDIKKNFEPCTADPCQTYASGMPAIYVLEVNAGFADNKNIKIGDTVIVPQTS